MIKKSASGVNESDARVFRELLLQVHGDITLALSDVGHAQRTSMRVRELSRRAGCMSEDRPVLDMLEVATSALSKALQHIDGGLDSSILYLRDMSDRDTNLIMTRQPTSAGGGGGDDDCEKYPNSSGKLCGHEGGMYYKDDAGAFADGDTEDPETQYN